MNKKRLAELVTPTAIALFRLCREIQDAGQQDTWEHQGGRAREYSNARVELHSLLGRLPADVNVMSAANPEAPSYCDPDHDYETAHELYVAFEGKLAKK
jgi:hypothetical protein